MSKDEELLRIKVDKREGPKNGWLRPDLLVDGAVSLSFCETNRDSNHQCWKACEIQKYTKRGRKLEPEKIKKSVCEEKTDATEEEKTKFEHKDGRSYPSLNIRSACG